MQTVDDDAERKEARLTQSLARARARIAALEELIRSFADTQFQSVIDASPVPYALNDEQQNITYLNPAFVQTFGYELDDIPTLSAWWSWAYPDEAYQQWVATTWARNLQQAKQTNQPFVPLELRIRCKDGSVRTVLASAAPLMDSYKGNHLVILYDITERKKVEDKLIEQENELVEIIEHLPCIVFLKDAKDLRYVRFNTAGEKIIGISRQEIMGKNDYDFFPKEQADLFTGLDRLVLDSGELQDIPDESIDTLQGTRRMHTRKVSIKGKDGKPKYLLGMAEDITQQKEMEAERARLQRELHQAQKMESLGQLTGGIAHDFNNILAIISGFTELGLAYCEESGDEKIMEYLHHIQSAQERAASLVAQMLSFSRNDGTDNQPLNIEPHVRENVRMLRAIMPATIQIDACIETGLPSVMMNVTSLNQIMMNLAINAKDAMDSVGRLDISLGWTRNLNAESSVSHQAVTGDWIELSVKDNGSGIEPDILEHIFTPFFTSKIVGKGTGMGLSVIYGIMKNSNGHILVESERGKGSLFRMLFPPLLDITDTSVEPEMSLIDEHKGTGEEILVVGDENDLAVFIGEILRQYGYRAHIMTDSAMAFEAFTKQPDRFPLVITDQTMPNITGLDLIEMIRGITPGQAAILCCGDSDTITASNTANNNIVFFEKPVDAKKLIQQVYRLLS